jgi:hypothetical protein
VKNRNGLIAADLAAYIDGCVQPAELLMPLARIVHERSVNRIAWRWIAENAGDGMIAP